MSCTAHQHGLLLLLWFGRRCLEEEASRLTATNMSKTSRGKKEAEDDVVKAVREGDITTLKSLLADMSPVDRRNAVDRKDAKGTPWYAATMLRSHALLLQHLCSQPQLCQVCCESCNYERRLRFNAVCCRSLLFAAYCSHFVFNDLNTFNDDRAVRNALFIPASFLNQHPCILALAVHSAAYSCQSTSTT